jgi:hypothetical protein
MARIEKRTLAAFIGGITAGYVVYRLVVGRQRTVDEAFGGESLDLTTPDFTPLEAQAFAEALPEAGQPYASLFVANARRVSISPFILAAIAERETGYGEAGVCRGLGPACIGSPGVKNPDYGLMQVNRKNLAPQGIATTWSDPAANIAAGAAILRQSVNFFGLAGGTTVDVPAWLAAKLIVAPGEKPDPRPVTDPRAALWYGISAYNAGPTRVLQAVAAGRSPDAVTTGNDYGLDVLKRAERIAGRTAAILSGHGSV